MSRVLIAAGVIRAGRRVCDLHAPSAQIAASPAPSGAGTAATSPGCFPRKQPTTVAGHGAETGSSRLDVIGGTLLVFGFSTLLVIALVMIADRGWSGAFISAGLLLTAGVIAYRAHRRGMRRWWTPAWRYLVMTGLLLAVAGILLPLHLLHPGEQAWRWDIAGWQTARMVTLALGLLEAPVLLDALLQRDGTWWLRVEHVVTGWVPFAGMLACFPYAPLWAGRRHGLGEVLPGLGCLLVVAAALWVQARIEREWVTRSRAVRAAGDVLDPGTHVGIDLGRLTELYAPGVTDDLTVALWLIPLGVRVRIATTTPRMVVEGLTTGKRGDSIRIGDQWVNTFDHAVTGLEILADDRTPAEREHSRTPALRPAPRTRQPFMEGTPVGLVAGDDVTALTRPAITIRDQNLSVSDSCDSDGRWDWDDPIPDLESRSVSAPPPQ